MGAGFMPLEGGWLTRMADELSLFNEDRSASVELVIERVDNEDMLLRCCGHRSRSQPQGELASPVGWR